MSNKNIDKAMFEAGQAPDLIEDADNFDYVDRKCPKCQSKMIDGGTRAYCQKCDYWEYIDWE